MGKTKDLFIEEYQRIEKEVDRIRDGGRPKVFGDKVHMGAAIDASRNCVTEPGKECSPMVGAALVKDNKLLGTAYRGELKPGEHAEYTLLEGKLKDVDVSGAILYTTLEPCTSRNPPKVECTQRIIDRGIGTVFIGTLDPNPVVCGVGELRLRRAKVKIGRFTPEYMQEVENLNKVFFTQFPLDSKFRRTASEKAEPAEPGGLFGPNGQTIGYDEEGNKVEWIEDEQDDTKVWPLILRRNDNAIVQMYDEVWEKVWWNRHMVYQHKEGLEECTGKNGMGCKSAARIVKKYGRENLGWNDLDWGLLQGKMSALAWVLGRDWEASLDT